MIRWLTRVTALAIIALLAVIAWDRYGLRPPTPDLAPLTEQIDRIEIDKSARKLTVFSKDTALRSYDIALGFAPQI